MLKLRQSIASSARKTLIVASVVLAPSALYAQSCAMCYQNAAASGPRMIAALKSGILVLMFPPMLIFGGILGLAFSRRNSFACEPQPQPGLPPETHEDIDIPLYD